MSVGPVPASRSLPAVLREQLETGGARVTLGVVVSVPDRAHVRVTIGDAQVTIPKLAAYVPTVGEPVYVLTDPLFTVALGTTSPTPPPAGVDADTLDGLDSADFMRNPAVLASGAAGGGLPFNLAVNFPRAVKAGLVEVHSTAFGGGSGHIVVGTSLDGGAAVGMHRFALVDDYPSRLVLTPALIPIFSKAAGAHTVNFQNFGNALMSADDRITVLLHG